MIITEDFYWSAMTATALEKTGTKELKTVSFNLSVNDGIRPYPTERVGWFSPTFHITGPVKNTRINNNIVLVPEKERSEIKPVIIEMDNWGNAWPKNTSIENNHFFVSAEPIFHWGEDQQTQFDGNTNEQLQKTDC